jgi:1-aminocyclopropane-1-carboxylate deaminase/D-cysteine desulfhydrase-like pyridoxal-dependent ACC family enzyme
LSPSSLDLTPVEGHGGHLVKRDDVFTVAGVAGGKVRTCWRLAQRLVEDGAPGLVTAGSRQSPQVNIVAHIAHELGVPCRVFTPAGDPGPEVAEAVAIGAERVIVKPGYNGVLIKRSRDDAAATGWGYIPFGMETPEAVAMTATQVPNVIAADPARIVVPVGSGMTLAGILQGLQEHGSTIPVLGVSVGADPTKRLDTYAPLFWPLLTDVVPSGTDYHHPAAATRLGELELDPIYEAKCLPFLTPDDLLWVVGIRATH